MVIAKWYGSRITALHVIHNPLLPEPPPSILTTGVARHDGDRHVDISAIRRGCPCLD